MKTTSKKTLCALLMVPLLLSIACNAQIAQSNQLTSLIEQEQEQDGDTELETATFGGGCFWCTEAVFQELKGVKSVTSGYAGGQTENPTYKDICTGTTGHAEIIQIKYDPEVISFAKLLEVHMVTHDPTTLNQQGADRGTQYRSVVFFHSAEQRDSTESIITQLNEAGAYSNPIVTEVTEYTKMYPAEDYHQNYYAANPNQGYCRAVIPPKMKKLKKVFADLLKDK